MNGQQQRSKRRRRRMCLKWGISNRFENCCHSVWQSRWGILTGFSAEIRMLFTCLTFLPRVRIQIYPLQIIESNWRQPTDRPTIFRFIFEPPLADDLVIFGYFEKEARIETWFPLICCNHETTDISAARSGDQVVFFIGNKSPTTRKQKIA